MDVTFTSALRFPEMPNLFSKSEEVKNVPDNSLFADNDGFEIKSKSPIFRTDPLCSRETFVRFCAISFGEESLR